VGVARQPTAEELLKEELGTIKVRKAKGSKNVTSGIVNVLASFNNTIVSITDQKGQVIAWSSAGKCNFRGSRKSTAYAAQVVAQDAARNAMSHGLKDVVIRVSGPRSWPRQCRTRTPGDRPGNRIDRGRHADSTQWLPPAQAPSRLMRNSCWRRFTPQFSSLSNLKQSWLVTQVPPHA
jgi:ribosomal protein S11